MLENIAKERILVTGGTGFLGSHVVSRLVAEKIVPIVLTRNSSAENLNANDGQVIYIQHDLLDHTSTWQIIEKLHPDRIIHLAGYTFKTEEQPSILEKFNHEATVNLLEAAAAVRVKRIILTGTADEYGFQNSPQTETMAAKPVSEYAVSKNKAVEYALEAFRKIELPIVVVRPFTIYGVGQPAKMFVAQAIKCAVTGTAFEMSKGEQKRDLLFVTDFVNAIIELLNTERASGEIYNLGSGESIALKTLAEKIWEIAGADRDLLQIGARPTGGSELHDTQADISKIKRMIGWKPNISLDKGLQIVVEQALADLR